MFSTAGRVVRSPSTLAPSSVCAFARPASVSAAQKPLAHPTSHQRRLSSSKASTPPDGSNANGSSSAQQTPARKVTGKTSRRKATTPPVPAINVPHVPSTDYLQKPEVKVSSFFSLHRPISLDQAIPPVTTNTSFDSIFAPRSPYYRKTTVENIQTLASGIESLEAALAVHDKQGLVEDGTQTEVHHLDGPPEASLEQLMAKFVPFKPPPAPVPYGQASEAQSLSNIVEDVVAPSPPIKRRAWSTTVVVTESTDASGNRIYSAKTAPMAQIVEPDDGQEVEQHDIRQPFLYRMSQRQIANNRNRGNLQRPDMLAISVKRQRKLKMKKHKYKKLMKRTRLERRKLDRA